MHAVAILVAFYVIVTLGRFWLLCTSDCSFRAWDVYSFGRHRALRTSSENPDKSDKVQ